MTPPPARSRRRSGRCRRFPALRAHGPGAPASHLALVAALVFGASPELALGQEPPDSLAPAADSVTAPPGAPADTLPPQVPDTLRGLPSDSVPGQVPDSLAQQVPDSLQQQVSDSAAVELMESLADQVPDSLADQPLDSIDPDTIPVPVMPSAVRGEALGWTNEVWEWNRTDLRSSRASELGELLALIPGTLPLRGGFYGMPRQVSAFAAGGGRIRVFWDGFEMLPGKGGVPDLARIGLGGVERVRAERTGGGMRVEIWSIEQSDPRPYTVIETGTGDLETQQFRGTFGHPRVLGGKLYVALDRMDTQGTDRQEPGTSVGYWLSYSYEPSETWGVRAEFRTMTSERDTLYLPTKVKRRDWLVRARSRLFGAAVGEVFLGNSALSADSLGPEIQIDHGQYGVRLGLSDSAFWVDGTARIQTGEGVPGSVIEARGGLASESLGGVEGTITREGWEGRGATSMIGRFWTRPFFGFSLFGSLDTGSRGVPFGPTPSLPDTIEDGGEVGESADTVSPIGAVQRFTDRTTTRLGAQFQWRGLRISSARLSVDPDSLHPLGLPPDRDGVVLAGERRSGFEVMGELPLLIEGLALRGSYQWWDEEPVLRYLPRRTWHAEIDWQRTFLASGNLEFLATVGVNGRDAMLVPLLAPEATPEDPLLQAVPWYQSWFARLQIRVLTFRIFINAENLANKVDNQDYPGRRLPLFRSFYGVRWTLWN